MAFFHAYTAYFDASGRKDQQKVMTVAGFVSTVKKWTRFDVEWNAILESEGIKSFHMTEFASSKGEFGIGWRGETDRRRIFIEKLVRCLKRNMNKAFRASLIIEDYNRVNKMFALEETIGRPYAVCGTGCLYAVHLWAERKKVEDKTLCYFEDGDQDKGNFAAKAKTSSLLLKPNFLAKEDAVAFQACDFAGWKYRTSITNALASDHTLEKGFRLLDSISALRSIPSKGGAGVWNPESLIAFCKWFDVPTR